MKVINVGLCAFGMSGKVFHAPFLKEHPGFVLCGIVERSKEESRQNYPEAVIYKSIEDLLQNNEIEIIVVNTPVQTHFEYAKKALIAGKNVVVEKPFTVTFTEAQALVNLAAEKKRFLSVFQNRRFDRDYLKVNEIIKSGNLGPLKEMEIRFDRFRPQPGSKEHKENPDLPGSGALHDLGAHLIDQATQLFGYPDKIFADVFAMKGNDFANDYFDLLLFYKTGLRVRVKSSVFIKESYFSYILHGENGTFLQERSDQQETELVAGAVPAYDTQWTKPLEHSDGILHYINLKSEEVREETASAPGNYMQYYDCIYDHITRGKPLPSPGEEILENMQLLEAALLSSAQEKVIKLQK